MKRLRIFFIDRLKLRLLRFGWAISKVSEKEEAALTLALISKFKISHVIDIGANSGQYALSIQNSDWKGKIESYEPDPITFTRLIRNSKPFENWDVHQFAVVNALNMESKIRLNIASNSGYSSSILKANETLYNFYPHISFENTVDVPTISLIGILGKFRNFEAILLKCDVQGYERELFKDLDLSELSRVQVIHVEISNYGMYENEWDLEECLHYFSSAGFKLFALLNEDISTEYGSIQFNLFFVREEVA
jgi:FkbM family methyltransferase